MKIKQRLELLVVVAVSAMLCIAWFGYYGISHGEKSIEDIGGNRLPSVSQLMVVKEALTDMSRNLYTVITAERSASLEKKKSELQVAMTRRSDAMKRALDAIKVYETLPSDAEEAALWKKTRESWDKWLVLEKQLIAAHEEALKNTTPDSVRLAADIHQKMIDDRRPITRDLGNQLQAVIDLNTREAAHYYQLAKTAADRAELAQIIAFIIGLAALAGVGFWVLRSVMRPIHIAQKTVIDISSTNDLTQRIDCRSKDEIGEMVESLNTLLEVLRQSMGQIQKNMGHAQEAVSTMTHAADEVAESSAHQSSAASSMAASVEQMTVSVATISDSAAEARKLAETSSEISIEGGGIIARTVEEMSTIAQMIRQASQVIASLGEDSQKIGSIVNAIKEIADQTNLLALNAAIEAARAGEAGRGFAVVADEVRKLAERTSQSTGDISRMVESIQTSSQHAVTEMESVVGQVSTGQELAVSAGERVHDIQEAVQKVAAAIVDISGALKEQSSASQDIARHVESIAQMTDENHAASESVSVAAKKVDSLSSDVVQIIQTYRV